MLERDRWVYGCYGVLFGGQGWLRLLVELFGCCFGRFVVGQRVIIYHKKSLSKSIIHLLLFF